MGLNLRQLRDHVVIPALEQLGMYSLAAEQLVIGTIAQESHGTYLHQLGNGPALGIIQMEPETHKDLWINFIKYNPKITAALLRMTSDSVDECYSANGWPEHIALVWNLRYAIAMCRVHYYRNPQALPASNDIRAIGQYWKTHYNTIHGAGSVDEFLTNFPFELYGLKKDGV